MEHCRSFLLGLGVGCVAGPLAGLALVAVSVASHPTAFATELGPIPCLLAGAAFGLPVGSRLGALLGSIADFRRGHREAALAIVGALLLLIAAAALFVAMIAPR